MIEWLQNPWPWYVGGPLLGLTVPILLFVGNKHFGVSTSLQHICSAVLPLKAEYFKYDWKKKAWSLFMMAGVVVGALIAMLLLDGDAMPEISTKAKSMFMQWGLADFSRLQPTEIFAVKNMLKGRNIILLIGGGFLVGFGTRYSNGCTSGHAVMGLSLLNLGSLVATIGFFVGGLLFSNLIVPAILSIG